MGLRQAADDNAAPDSKEAEHDESQGPVRRLCLAAQRNVQWTRHFVPAHSTWRMAQILRHLIWPAYGNNIVVMLLSHSWMRKSASGVVGFG